MIRSLTEREVEVLTQVADGLTNPQIAHALGISLSTVRYHLSTSYEKLDVQDRTAAVVCAMRLGVLPPKRASSGG